MKNAKRSFLNSSSPGLYMIRAGAFKIRAMEKANVTDWKKILPGKPYTPSNGTEGTWFISKFCDNCVHQHPDPENPRQCYDILLKSLMGGQPPEWVYNEEAEPVCTAFVKFDWGDEDDGWNDPDGPDSPIQPEDPNQLLIPFDISELFFFDQDIIVTKRAIIETSAI